MDPERDIVLEKITETFVVLCLSHCFTLIIHRVDSRNFFSLSIERNNPKRFLHHSFSRLFRTDKFERLDTFL